MKKYTVDMLVELMLNFEVEANSLEEAKLKAHEQYHLHTEEGDMRFKKIVCIDED